VKNSDGIVRISLDSKGRKGKDVTVITGIPVSEDTLETLAKQLKRKCGAGGTVKDLTIEIQGDHRKTIMTELVLQGYKVRSI
jgi:translation initiation factor 1